MVKFNVKILTIVAIASLCLSIYVYFVLTKIQNLTPAEYSTHISSHVTDSYSDIEQAYIQKLEHQRNQYTVVFITVGLGLLIALITLSFYFIRVKQGKGRAEKNLERTRENLLLTLDAVNDGIYDWNVKTGAVSYSKQFWKMLGYDVYDFDSRYESFKGLVHPEDIVFVERQIQDYLSQTTSEYAITFRMKHKDGHWVWINSRGKASFDRLGKPVRMIGTHTDISPLKIFERKLLIEKEKVEKASNAKTDFLAHMSHEIRTPLTAISGISNIFKNNIDEYKDRDKELIKVLAASTDSLIDLVNDVLDFAKIESGEIDIESQPFALDELCEQINAIFSIKAQEKGLDFSFGALPESTITGDKVRLRQILINLIGNSIKFTEEGAVNVDITQTKWDGKNCLRFDIKDTGIGIKPEKIGQIFEKFKQGDSSVSRKYGGTGLGLPISKQLAHLMGGDILVESQIGKGTVFSLIIPSQGLATITATNIGEKQFPSTSTLDNKNYKILLVEDYSGNVAMLTYMLESMLYECDVAKDGLEAFERYKKNSYDLILMDIQMPEMDGLTATKKIRRYETANSIKPTPIIGMTANATALDKKKSLWAGMDAYLSKPIKNSDLGKTIQSLLEQT